MKLIKICLVGAVLCVQMSNILAAPWFNFAVQTKSGDDGHKVSLVYPRMAHEVSFNFKHWRVNDHSFDFAGLISSITKHVTGLFSGFSGGLGGIGNLSNLSSFSNPLKPATSTAEPFDEFGKDGDNSWSSLDGDSDSSSSTTEESSFSEDSNSDFTGDSGSDFSAGSTDIDVRDGLVDNSNGYKYPKQTTGSGSVTQESVKVSYLPPVTSMRPPLTPAEPTKKYLPPSTKKPANIYLPSF